MNWQYLFLRALLTVFSACLHFFHHVFLAYLDTTYILCYAFSEGLTSVVFKICKKALRTLNKKEHGQSEKEQFKTLKRAPLINVALNSWWSFCLFLATVVPILDPIVCISVHIRQYVKYERLYSLKRIENFLSVLVVTSCTEKFF